jgi:hypothetical protein
MRSSLQHYSIKNPHIAQRCRVSLMPSPKRIGEANPGCAKLASALFHKKPAHRAAMPGFFDASPGQDRRSQSWVCEARFSIILKKPAHRAAMPGFFGSDPCRIDAFHRCRLYTTSMDVAKSARG